MQGKLDMGHARALLAVSGQRQVELAHQVVSRGLSVRETEQLAGRTEVIARKTPRKHRKDRDLQALEEDLAEMLGAPVNITPGKGGKGKLVIGYSSLDQLDEILARLRGQV
jgi:ParB family chromosome partitioning protein